MNHQLHPNDSWKLAQQQHAERLHQIHIERMLQQTHHSSRQRLAASLFAAAQKILGGIKGRHQQAPALSKLTTVA